MAGVFQAAKSLLLLEFGRAFMLSMRQFFSPKKTLNYPHEKGPYHRGFAANTPCVAIPMVKSAALPANFAKQFVRRRPLPLKPVRAAMTGHAGRFVTTSIWSSASIADSVRKHARWMRSSKGRISSSRRRPERNSITTRRNFSPTAIAGSGRLLRTWFSMRRIDD